MFSFVARCSSVCGSLNPIFILLLPILGSNKISNNQINIDYDRIENDLQLKIAKASKSNTSSTNIVVRNNQVSITEVFLATLWFTELGPIFSTGICLNPLGPIIKLFQSSKIEKAIAKF